MNPIRRPLVVAAAVVGVVALSGCASGDHDAHSGTSPTSTTAPSTPAAAPSASATSSDSSMGGHGHHTGMSTTPSGSALEGHAMDGGAPPAGIRPAASPRYPVGAKVVLTADHMPGMKGATATVTGAYSTTTYAVTYTPTTGGPVVRDHKWVVHEELNSLAAEPLRVGSKVELGADHMPGMLGAKATIDRVTTETVYMVDVDAPGMPMKNHKWVVESEMRPAR